jgi:hypothetical protein
MTAGQVGRGVTRAHGHRRLCFQRDARNLIRGGMLTATGCEVRLPCLSYGLVDYRTGHAQGYGWSASRCDTDVTEHYQPANLQAVTNAVVSSGWRLPGQCESPGWPCACANTQTEQSGFVRPHERCRHKINLQINLQQILPDRE